MIGIVKGWSRWLTAADVEVSLSSGRLARGELQPDFERERLVSTRLVEGAFTYQKQCAAPNVDQSIWVPATHDPTDDFFFFNTHTLTFGASGGVIQFNRVSVALCQLCVTALSVPAVTHFDDFPLFVPAAAAVLLDLAFWGEDGEVEEGTDVPTIQRN